MAEMNYSKNVSGSSNTISVPNINVGGMDLYGSKTVTAKASSTIYNTTDSSLDLSVFLTDNIDETVSSQKIAADKVKHYETDVPWYCELLDGVKCAGATIVNSTMGLLEGVTELAEGILDAAVVVASVGTVGVPLLLADTLSYVGSKILGTEYNSLTEAYWTDFLMPIVGYDISGNAFDALYSTDLMSAVDEHALDAMKRGGAGYKIAKNVGYVTGTVALGIFTGGAGFAGLTASSASTLAAGLGKAGNTFESKYNSLSDEDKQDIGKIGGVLLNGTLAGSLEAGMWFLTYGNGLDKIATKLGPSASKFLGTTVFKLSGNSTFTKMVAKIFPNAIKNSSLVKGGLQFLKPFATLGIDAGTTGLKIDENTTLADHFLNATIDGLTNAVVTIGYDASFLKTLVENTSAKASTTATGKTDYLYAGNSKLAQNATGIENAGLGDQTIYKSLTEAISKYQYNPATAEGGTSHLTRLLFEGLKKSGGNLVKKNISAPIKQGIQNFFDLGGSIMNIVFGH